MVVTLVVLTVICCLAFDMFRQHRMASASLAVTAGPPVARDRAARRLLHPGHGWALVEALGRVKLGIDELAGRLIGIPEVVQVPPAGAEVRQGEPLVTLRRAGKALTITSPLTGKVVESNTELAGHPGLVRTSPHEKGWIARIIPARLDVELRNLLDGPSAEGWREAAEAQVRSWFAPGIGVVLQDGGAWVEDLAEQVSDEDWNRMARDLFHIPPA